ncbi:hypothetical protein CDG81_17755 [Actinopolyspora erythraea]|uniref:EcsC family protein n=1 Tax=Actinopolyspora erythraea TaxID=414996 RepID=A0A099D0E1_9ACTN|nr:hypothetical protein [Actinopolyspora erythraea]ASU79800.1 hypothetical protein CDG81_17755 [Actinopolyspora erythraea]KGI79683.1 hypothetical protein IL38_22320 [Actinopolyspora erythraea]
MAELITDERLAEVLRPFVRACDPVLSALRESDPLRLRGRFDRRPGGDAFDASGETAGELEPAGDGRGGADAASGARRRNVAGLLRRLDGMRLPGSSAWDAMTVAQRCDWWSVRVGRFLAAIVGLPRFGGVITSKLPLRNALGTVAQGLVLVAVAGEHGLHDRAEQVRLIAHVLFGRDIPREVAAGGAQQRREDERRAAELSGELRGAARPRAGALVRAVWRMARAVWEVHAALDARPQGALRHEVLGSLPVVGVVGGYLGERAALRTIARKASGWINKRGKLSTG